MVPMCFPIHGHLGHHVIGNSITVQHATLALGFAMMAFKLTTTAPAELVLQTLAKRFHAGNAKITLIGDDLVIDRCDADLAHWHALACSSPTH